MQKKLPPKNTYTKTTANALKPHVGSLKEILNRNRVSLAKYINDKGATTFSRGGHNQPFASYYDKLKSMMEKNQKSQSGRELKVPQTSKEVANTDNERSILRSDKQLSIENFDQNKDRIAELEQGKKPKQTEASVGLRDSRSRDRKPRTELDCLKTIDKYGLETVDLPKAKSRFISNNTHTQKQLSAYQHSPQMQDEADPSVEENASKDLVLRQIHYYKECKKELVNYKKFHKVNNKGRENLEVVELDQIIGSGANANVKIGTNLKTGATYAIKIYDKYKLQEQKQRDRVNKEIDILSSLDHERVIALINSYEDKRQIHMVFELIPNAVTLEDYIRLLHHRVQTHVLKDISIKVVEGVEYLHAEQISHRDIKTDNVLLTSKGVVKLIDFGFAVTGPRGDVSCGTPNYMAPELFLRNTSYSPIKVDIWALGVLIYYLFEGSYPFRGYSERELIKNIHKGTYSFQKSPPEIQKVINLGLRMNPDARGTCTDMLAILRE